MQNEITKTISGYDIFFPEDNIHVAISSLRFEKNGIKGNVGLTLGKAKIAEPDFDFNFSSDITRKRLTTTLSEKYDEWDYERWLEIIDTLCRNIQSLAKEGEPSTIIKPTTSGVKHPGFYVEPFIMKGVPNVIYGDKGSKKTTLGLCLLGLVALGVNPNQFDFKVNPARVALLDWENNLELTDYTLSRLVEGQTIPYFELPYLRCVQPLADDLDRIGQFLQDNKTEVVMIDSLGKAAGSDRFDTAGKNSALRFFQALSEFNLTSLSIGQNAKDDTGKKTIYGSTYYTYYSRNIFRAQNSRDSLGEDEEVCALVHEEANFSRKYQPYAFKLAYTDETIKIEPEVATLSQFFDRVNQTQALFEFLKSGAKSVKEISTELEISDNRTRVLLSKLKKRYKVVNLSSGMWGAASDIQE